MSSSFGEWLSGASEQYLQSKQLSDSLSQKDSMGKPYESKYKAKQIITHLLEQLPQFSADHTLAEDMNTPKVLELLLEYELGSIDLDTEETANAEKHFDFCLNLLEDLVSDPKSDPNKVVVSLTLFYIVVNNQLAYIWCSRDDFPKAETYLKSAEKAYNLWTKCDPNYKHFLIDFLDVFVTNPLSDDRVSQRGNDQSNNGVKNVESGHTLTLYLMAQTYERMGDNSKAAVYCHSTLKRQYKQIEDPNSGQLYDPIDWVLNAATLSQYFAINSDFDASRHHICCALKVINSCNSDEQNEKYRKCLADLNRIIVKYCLMLLESSANAIKANLIVDSEQAVQAFRPYLLNDPEVEELEKTIKTFPIIELIEAQQVFKYANRCLTEAMSFYTLTERASDYVECIQDKSKLFQYLIPFDVDYDRQCKMHKRRIDALEALLSEISPKHFMGQCRQILYELAEIYSQMAGLKTQLMNDRPEEEQSSQSSAVKKINQLIMKSISSYDDFLKTFREESTDLLPQILPEDYIRPILLAQFSIGRLHSKFISTDPREELKNWTKCEEYYVKVKDYLERNPEQKHQFEEELPLLEEMLKLIPGRMQMILSSHIY